MVLGLSRGLPTRLGPRLRGDASPALGTCLAATDRVPRVKPEDALRCAALVLCRSGGLSEAPKPDPISNSAVKRLSAHDTVAQATGK